jgi:hypothetical protein
LLGYLRPYLGLFFATIGAALFTSFIELSQPWVIRNAVDEYMSVGPTGRFYQCLLTHWQVVSFVSLRVTVYLDYSGVV